MTGRDKIIRRVRQGNADADIRFLYWSEQDRAVIAEVPELPGCVADGATYEEALDHAQIVIQQWIETAQSLGRPIPAPRGKLMYA